MGFDYEFKHTPTHQESRYRMQMLWAEWILTKNEYGNDRVCFEINKIYCAQSDLVTQAENKNWTWNKQTLSGHIETNQKWQLETMFRSWKRIWTTQRCTDHTQWNHLERCFCFHSTQTKTLCFGKNAWDTTWEECNWDISQNDSLLAWLYPRRSTFW